MGRRSYGTGSLYVHTDAAGRETWYGRWHIGAQRLKRRIGPKRPPGSRHGLTRAQAERALQRLIETERPSPTRPAVTVEDAGERLISQLEALGRKPTTLATYRSLLRAHLATHLGGKSLDQVRVEDVEALVAAMRRGSTGSKTIRNALALLHQIFTFGQRKGWCAENPALASIGHNSRRAPTSASSTWRRSRRCYGRCRPTIPSGRPTTRSI